MDTTFDLLSNPRRRFTLYYLSQHDEEVSLNEIAAEIAAWENHVDVEELSDAQQKRTYVSLYQTHLPKMTDVGVIEFDRERSVVQLTEKAKELEAYLPSDGREYSWPAIYGAYAAITAVLYGLAVIDVLGTGVLAEASLGGVIVLGIALLSVIHYVTEVRGRESGLSQLVQ
jgi:hypothetical protein